MAREVWTVPELVGERMREARGATSQAEFGKALGEALGRPAWPAQAISAAEQGRRRFTAEEILSLAWLTRRPVSWFFTPPGKGDKIELPDGAVTAKGMAGFVIPSDAYEKARPEVVRTAGEIKDALLEAIAATERLIRLHEGPAGPSRTERGTSRGRPRKGRPRKKGGK